MSKYGMFYVGIIIDYILPLYFSSENAKGWATELTKILNRDEKFVLVTYLQLVGVCLYVFVKPELAPYIKGVLISEGILISVRSSIRVKPNDYPIFKVQLF